MKNWKSLLILLLTLVLGFSLGFLVAGQWSKKRFKRFARGLRSPELMSERWMHALELEEKQKDTVRPILLRYAEQHANLHRGMRENVDSLFKAMHSELQPLLTEEQNHQLQKRQERRRQHGPPPE